MPTATRDAAPLNGEHILDLLAARREALQAMGVRTLGLFGSYRRGTPSAGSDIDLLVTLAHPSFREYMEIKFFLEDLFARPVDLVLEDGLKPQLRGGVLGEVAYVTGLSPLPR